VPTVLLLPILTAGINTQTSSVSVMAKATLTKVKWNNPSSSNASWHAGYAALTEGAVNVPACSSPKETAPQTWKTFTAFASLLNSLNAPWNIHGGLLLGLARGCYIFDSDLDFAVDRSWLRTNHDKFESALVKAGFEQADTLGKLDYPGYEEKYLPPPALRGSAVPDTAGANNLGPIKVKSDTGIPLDLFAIDRFDDRYEWLIWVSQTDVGKCITDAQGTQTFNWHGQEIKVPYPIETALTSLYGKDYMTPLSKQANGDASWVWNKHPFTTGSCHLESAPYKLPEGTYPWWFPKYLPTEEKSYIIKNQRTHTFHEGENPIAVGTAQMLEDEGTKEASGIPFALAKAASLSSTAGFA